MERPTTYIGIFGQGDRGKSVFSMYLACAIAEHRVMASGQYRARDIYPVCVIDFDDGGFGWHMFDFATALFFHLGEDYFDDLLGAMVEGYSQYREITDEQLEKLPLFLFLRARPTAILPAPTSTSTVSPPTDATSPSSRLFSPTKLAVNRFFGAS